VRVLCGMVVSLALAAQQPAPAGVVRGELLEWDAGETAGELVIGTADHHVFHFLFDARTYVERDKQCISIGQLRKGDALEIVSDRVSALSLGYARTVHVLDRQAQARAAAQSARLRAYRSPIENIAPRGDLTFSGIISRLHSQWLVLRTRLDGEKAILLRRDTRYLEDGFQVDAASLKPNTRVFVRAGRNLDDELEAYQVVWGEILFPGPVSLRP
jgi:hypothetical protein